MATVYLGLGSNLGNRLGNLRMALRLLARLGRLEAVSSLYETEPMGRPAQPPFYNAVCRLTCGLEPRALLRFLQNLERELGRRPTGQHWGPRPIDLDILLYDDRLLEEADLIIPHPRLAERAFVLVPLCELAGDMRHPALGKTMAELSEAIDQSGVNKITPREWEKRQGRKRRR